MEILQIVKTEKATNENPDNGYLPDERLSYLYYRNVSVIQFSFS